MYQMDDSPTLRSAPQLPAGESAPFCNGTELCQNDTRKDSRPAGKRATDDDIYELERIWSAHEEVQLDAKPGGLIEAFHLKLASMTRNPALEAAARPLIQLVTIAFRPAATKGSLEGKPSIVALQWAVLDAVKLRDSALASRRMIELMESAYGRLRKGGSDLSSSIAADPD
jgi:DNA-binding FadR family transcriptional regulator